MERNRVRVFALIYSGLCKMGCIDACPCQMDRHIDFKKYLSNNAKTNIWDATRLSYAISIEIMNYWIKDYEKKQSNK